MKLAFVEAKLPGRGAVAVAVSKGKSLSLSAATLDETTGGSISRALAHGRFSGERGEALVLHAPAGTELHRIFLLGHGAAGELDEFRAQAAGAKAWAEGNAAGDKDLTIMVDPLDGCPLADPQRAALIAFGARLRSYRFDKYLTKEPAEKKPTLKKVTVAVKGAAAARRAYAALEKLADAVTFTRDLVSEPANVLYPESYAHRIRDALRPLGAEVEILGEREMRKLGMNTLLGVGQGSDRESQLVIMQWHGNRRDRSQGPLAFIGKGVTFDTGGISIKPAQGMEDMKWDMGGSAAVVGLMHALAARKAKVNAIGIVGLVENMPSGKAQRPGDIVKSLSGQTVEVLNTDAEGRLVLADALWYCQDRFKPRFMIDLATLTGAIMIALGKEHAGMFCNNEELAERLTAAGKVTGETLWRLPLGDAYDRMIDGDASDVKNISNGRYAGSITAAQFLQRFTNNVPWAHLDIAGTAWADKDKPTAPKGATAYGVQLLHRLVSDYYEAK